MDIAGLANSCLLDIGSQVTTIPISFYSEHLKNQPVKPLHNLLQVEGMAGQSVPYLRCVELVITFLEDFMGVSMEVPTLALVIPDTRLGWPSPMLIGMNTLEPLYELHLSSDCSDFQLAAQGYHVVLKLLHLKHQQSQAGSVGTIRLSGITPHSSRPDHHPGGLCLNPHPMCGPVGCHCTSKFSSVRVCVSRAAFYTLHFHTIHHTKVLLS